MSASSRSIAAARQRRAGDPPSSLSSPSTGIRAGGQAPPQTNRPPMNPFLQQQQQAQQQQAQQQEVQQVRPQTVPELPQQIGVGPGKMPMSDVISLVTLRLSKIETYILKLQAEETKPNSIDPSVIQGIIARLETLEAKPAQIQSQEKKQTTHEDTESQEELKEKVEWLFTEMESVKDMLLKTQSFTMETNQKLVDIVLSPPPPSFSSSFPPFFMDPMETLHSLS
jgi:hypothetical protein